MRQPKQNGQLSAQAFRPAAGFMDEFVFGRAEKALINIRITAFMAPINNERLQHLSIRKYQAVSSMRLWWYL